MCKGCIRADWLDGAFAILTHAIAINNAGGDGHLPRGSLAHAFNITLSACIQRQQLRRAALLVQEMKSMDVNVQRKCIESLIVVLVNARDMDGALTVYDRVVALGQPVPRLVYKLLLFGAMRAGMWDAVQALSEAMPGAGLRPLAKVDRLVKLMNATPEEAAAVVAARQRSGRAGERGDGHSGGEE